MASEGFICPECKKSFVTSDELSVHFKGFHLVKPVEVKEESLTSISEDLAQQEPLNKPISSKPWGFINTITSKFETKDSDKVNISNLEKKLESMKKYVRKKNDEIIQLKLAIDESKLDKQKDISSLIEHMLLSEVLLFYDLNSHQNPILVDQLCGSYFEKFNVDNETKSIGSDIASLNLKPQESTDVINVEIKLNEMTSKCEKLEADLSNSKAKVKKYAEVLKTVKTKFKTSTEQFKTEKENLTKQLQKKVQKADEFQSELKDKVSQLKKLLADKKDETLALKKENGELIKKQQTMKDEINSLKVEIESLSGFKTSNESKLECMKTSNTEMTERVRNLEELREKYDAEKEKITIKLEHSKQEMNKLEIQSAKYQKNIDDLKERLAKSEKENKTAIASCNVKIDSFRGKYEEASQEICTLSEKNSRLLKELNQVKEKYDSLNAELTEKNGIITNLQEDFKRCEENYSKVNDEHEQVITSINVEKTRMLQLERSCRDNNLVISEMGEKIVSLKDEIVSVYNGKWQTDDETTKCHNCLKDFYVARRRHHCRWCGKIMCYKCCENFIFLRHSEGQQRVCDPCKNKFDLYRED